MVVLGVVVLGVVVLGVVVLGVVVRAVLVLVVPMAMRVAVGLGAGVLACRSLEPWRLDLDLLQRARRLRWQREQRLAALQRSLGLGERRALLGRAWRVLESDEIVERGLEFDEQGAAVERDLELGDPVLVRCVIAASADQGTREHQCSAQGGSVFHRTLTPSQGGFRHAGRRGEPANGN